MAQYGTGVNGVSFYVNCSNSISGSYPNIVHNVSYTIQLHHDYSANSTSWNGAVLYFGGNSHTVNISHSGAGTWTLATGSLSYGFGSTSNSDSRSIGFSTSFGNISASGSQTESASFNNPGIGSASLTVTGYSSLKYSASLSSNPYSAYTIRAELNGKVLTGDSGTFTGLSPNTKYTVNIYAVWKANTGSKVSGATSRSATTSKPSAPTRGSVSAKVNSWNSATLSWSGFSISAGASSYYYQYSLNGGSWTNCGASTSYTWQSLSAYTTYTFYVRMVDNYGTASGAASVSFTTNKPDRPNKGTVTVSDILPFSAKLTFSGFSINAGASSYSYQYSYDGSNWNSNGTGTTLELSSLTPETTYNIRVRMLDNFGQASDVVTATFTTLADQVKLAYNKDGETLQQARLWYNDKGTLKKVKKAYYNENGTIKVHTNYGN